LRHKIQTRLSSPFRNMKNFFTHFVPQKPVKENLFVVLFLCLLLSISFYDVVFFKKTFKLTTAGPQALFSGPYGQEKNKPSYFPLKSPETSYMEEPLYEFVKKSLRDGILPLWNPHQGCGFPLVGAMEPGFFFPLNFLLYFLPQIYAWDIMILLRFLLAGLFTYWLMRTLRFNKISSWVAAIAFMLSGPMVLIQYWFVNVEILAPLVLLSLERLIRENSLRNRCLVALVVALTFIAGHPEHVLFVNTFGFIYFCFRVFTLRRHLSIKNSFVHLFGAYLLGFGLCAFVWMPFLRDFATELWHSHSADLLDGTNDKREMITLAFPYFFQKEPIKLNFDRVGWWGEYLGIFSLGLAFLSLFRKQRRGLNYFLAVMAFLNIAKTYIRFFSLSWIVYVPIFRYCRFYPHTAHLFALSVAILAGMGTRVLLSGKKNFRKGLIFTSLLVLSVGALLFHFRKADHFPVSIRAAIVGLCVLFIFQLILFLKDKRIFSRRIFSAVLIAAVSLELAGYVPRGRVNRFDSYPPVPYIEIIKNAPERARTLGVFWTLYPNTASGYRVDDFNILISLLPKRFVYFFNHFILRNHFKKNLQTCSLPSLPLTFMADPKPYLDLLNIRFTAGPDILERLFPLSARENFPQPIYSQEAKLFYNPQALSRAFIVHRAVFEPDEEQLFARIEEIKNRFKTVIVIHHPPVPEIEQALSRSPLSDPSTAKIVRYTPNEVTIEADLENAGFLVLSDVFHPDWKAFVDETPAKIFITNYLIRSVFLSPGQHRVRFIFQPPAFYIGSLVSLFSLIIFVIFVLRKRLDRSGE